MVKMREHRVIVEDRYSPVTVVHHPMVLIREDNETRRHTKSTVTYLSTQYSTT